eukprot:TRINITY_DN567_c0_g1_i1.p1 TRINITY_DN567_c0_g1~~TRINITY_DN567_c0_g1_i1.p1  ORF type:complete len:311 (-),score=123.09 TRINITY_DN567_c0_g1_i1:8-904(-)
MWFFLGGVALGFLLCALIFSYFIGPPQTPRRKLMIASWGAPSEGNIYGAMECDATKALQYIKEQKEQGNHVTITNIAIKAVALSLKAAPSMNGRLIWGKFFPHKTIDIGCLVNINDGKDLANAKITDVDKKTTKEIGEVLQQKAGKLRSGKDADWNKTLDTIKILPVFVIRRLVYTVGFLSSALGLNLPMLGVRPFPFGSCLVTSVGMMGLDMGFAPFTPFARVPILVMVGAIREKPVVVDGEIVVRPIITLTATLDHRFLDGAQGAALAKYLRLGIEDPAQWDRDFSNDVLYTKKSQ